MSLPVASLHQIEICITQNEPFCARRLKIDLDPGMSALPLAIQDDAVAELAVTNTLSEPNPQLVAGR